MPSRLVRAVAPFAVLCVLATGVVAGSSAGAKRPKAPEVRTGVMKVPTVTDAGRKSTLRVHWAAPAKKPRALVVVFHGYGHNGDEWRPQLRTIAERDRALALAMHTRETKTSKGPFNSVDEMARGAASAIATVQKQRRKPLPVHLFCVSMGCTGAAYLIDAATRPAAGDRDARFVQRRFDGGAAGLVVAEGLSNLVETWAEAAAADPVARAGIEHETRRADGDAATPAQNPPAYRSRSLALLPRARLTAFGIDRAAVIHPVNDGSVPVNQGLETRAALAAAGVPFHGYTVLRTASTGCDTEHQTTGTSHVSDQLDGPLCLAGHATETRTDTPVMRTAHAALRALIRGELRPGESTVEPTAGLVLGR